MSSFLSDTFFKSFSSKYVYVEAATTMAVPSHVLSPLYTVQCTCLSAEIETGMVGKSEPVFVDLLRSHGIDSQPAGRCDNPLCHTGLPGYIGWQNRFLGIDSCAP
jgi:hypothetical protein